MKFKGIYHIGDEINLKTKVQSGVLSITNEQIKIEGTAPRIIDLSSCNSVEMFRLNGLGRMIKLVSKRETFFLSVVRLNILGLFVIVNFKKTGKLFNELQNKLTTIKAS
nr:hypothetical protein [uncultured Desulfuromonas sp.]